MYLTLPQAHCPVLRGLRMKATCLSGEGNVWVIPVGLGIYSSGLRVWAFRLRLSELTWHKACGSCWA